MGQLTQTVSINSSNVNLTSVGLVDWSDWTTTLTASDYKNGAGHTIPNPTLYGTGATLANYSGDARTISWTDGTNTASSSNGLGIYSQNYQTNDGFQFVLPADTNIRTLYIYMGGYGLGTSAVVTSSLSDSSAAAQTNSSTLVGTSSTSIDGVIKLVYAANSSSQSLTLQFYVPFNSPTANVTLNAAALASVAAPFSNTAPTWLMFP